MIKKIFVCHKVTIIHFSEEEEGESSKEGKSEEDLKKLEQDAAEQFAAINNKEIAPEIDIKTGEEDEKCVLQVLLASFHESFIS